MLLDKPSKRWHILILRPKVGPYMTQNNRKNINEVLIKFVAPEELKESLQKLANERNITLSALLRLVVSEYVRRKQSP